MNGVALVAPLPRPNQGAVWKEITAQKLRGFQPLARSMDKRRAESPSSGDGMPQKSASRSLRALRVLGATPPVP